MKLLTLFMVFLSSFAFAEINDGSVEMKFPVTQTRAMEFILVVDNSGSMSDF